MVPGRQVSLNPSESHLSHTIPHDATVDRNSELAAPQGDNPPNSHGFAISGLMNVDGITVKWHDFRRFFKSFIQCVMSLQPERKMTLLLRDSEPVA